MWLLCNIAIFLSARCDWFLRCGKASLGPWCSTVRCKLSHFKLRQWQYSITQFPLSFAHRENALFKPYHRLNAWIQWLLKGSSSLSAWFGWNFHFCFLFELVMNIREEIPHNPFCGFHFHLCQIAENSCATVESVIEERLMQQHILSSW